MWQGKRGRPTLKNTGRRPGHRRQCIASESPPPQETQVQKRRIRQPDQTSSATGSALLGSKAQTLAGDPDVGGLAGKVERTRGQAGEKRIRCTSEAHMCSGEGEGKGQTWDVYSIRPGPLFQSTARYRRRIATVMSLRQYRMARNSGTFWDGTGQAGQAGQAARPGPWKRKGILEEESGLLKALTNTVQQGDLAVLSTENRGGASACAEFVRHERNIGRIGG